jgi:hypothetical protein
MSYLNQTNNNNNSAKRAGLSWWRRTFGTSLNSAEEIKEPSSTADEPDPIPKHDIGPRKVPSQVMSSQGWGRDFWKPARQQQEPDSCLASYREMPELSIEEEELYCYIVVKGVKDAKAELDQLVGLVDNEEVQLEPLQSNI